ncbi:MAG: hypothetical protein A2X86_02460 [Bdellovibrionales bacterium GWA2_49_15]|nr:MAG: hypothetical protein A2X86_02460 [Bdellovibrionales bacterium GWA2_49_15]
MQYSVQPSVLYALYTNTIKKEIRSKTIIFVFLLNLGLIFVVNSGIDLVIKSVEEQNLMNLSGQKAAVFYFLINIWCTVLSVIFGVDCIKSDLESGVASVLMAQPLRRWWYLLMRILGAATIVFGHYLLSLLLAGIIFYLTDGTNQLNLQVIGALGATLLVNIAVITLSAVISLSVNKLVAFIMTMVACTIISLSNQAFIADDLMYHLKSLGLAKVVGLTAHYLFPRIGMWSTFASGLVTGKTPVINYMWELPHYGVTLLGLFCLLAFLFSRKEL